MSQYLLLKDFSTTEISDALDACGVEGALLNIKPLNPGARLIGPAYTVEYSVYEKKEQQFNPAGNYIDAVPAHAVIVIDNKARNHCTVWGDILTQVAIQKKIAGTIVNGAVRDIACIRAAQYPLYSTGNTMRSGKNRVYKSAEQCPLVINEITIRPGDIIVADDDGVIVIPLHLLQEVIYKAKNINATEQKIIAAVKAGSSLEQARRDYRYDKPWLNGEPDR